MILFGLSYIYIRPTYMPDVHRLGSSLGWLCYLEDRPPKIITVAEMICLINVIVRQTFDFFK